MFIKNPKGNLFGFSGDGRYLALIERTECNDYVAVLNTRTWKLTNHFKLPTIDVTGFEWVSYFFSPQFTESLFFESNDFVFRGK